MLIKGVSQTVTIKCFQDYLKKHELLSMKVPKGSTVEITVFHEVS